MNTNDIEKKEKLDKALDRFKKAMKPAIDAFSKFEQILKILEPVSKEVMELLEKKESPVAANRYDIYTLLVFNDFVLPNELRYNYEDAKEFAIFYILMCLIDDKIKGMWLSNHLEAERAAKTIYGWLISIDPNFYKKGQTEKLALPQGRLPQSTSIYSKLKQALEYSEQNNQVFAEAEESIKELLAHSKVRNLFSHSETIYSLIVSQWNNIHTGYCEEDLSKNIEALKTLSEKYKVKKDFLNNITLSLMQISQSYPKLNLAEKGEKLNSSGILGDIIPFSLNEVSTSVQNIMWYILNENLKMTMDD